MPHYSLECFRKDGPLLAVFSIPSLARTEILKQAGLPIPDPVNCRLLVDTGASFTAIDQKIIDKLGLPVIDTVIAHTPSSGSSGVELNCYEVQIIIAGKENFWLPPLKMAASDFSAQDIDGLIGRDILQLCRMTYCGPENAVLLSF